MGDSGALGQANRESDVYGRAVPSGACSRLYQEEPQGTGDRSGAGESENQATAHGFGTSLDRRIMRRNPHIGGDFEDFLADEGDLQSATALAVKRVLAWQLTQAMKKAKVSRAELARRMNTSRAVVHRLLNADDPAVTLATISRAAVALQRRVRLEITA
ncbi:MAG: helix-turn-helix transcriptional regulator [Steroidobacteraceae bacterium]